MALGQGTLLLLVAVAAVDGLRLAAQRASRNELLDRIAAAIVPTAGAEECGGVYNQGNDGAGYRWCNNVINRAVSRSSEDGLLGLSYGILNWDAWSRYMSNLWGVRTSLWDCYATSTKAPFKGIHAEYQVPYTRNDICVAGAATTNQDGQKFEAFHEHLAKRPARGTLMKMDVEGSEWDILKSVTDEELGKIDTLDMEIHMCIGLPGLHRTNVFGNTTLVERVELLERLQKTFKVVGVGFDRRGTDGGGQDTAGEMKRDQSNVDKLCDATGKVTAFGAFSDYPNMFSISYVNKARLLE